MSDEFSYSAEQAQAAENARAFARGERYVQLPHQPTRHRMLPADRDWVAEAAQTFYEQSKIVPLSEPDMDGWEPAERDRFREIVASLRAEQRARGEAAGAG